MLCKRQMSVPFFVLLMIAMTTRVAQAQVRPVGLSDSQEPGSVLVFPLFETGNVPGGATPKSSFEISVVCPKGASCTDGQDVDLHADWVCAGSVTPTVSPCADSDFNLDTTINGTIRFNPQTTTGGPRCSQGFLLVWVIEETSSGRPIKFDGLIGDAVVRDSAAAATAYNAIPIQANATLANGAVIPSGSTSLNFNVTSYQEITGNIFGSLRYDFVGGTAPVETDLVLLTLDTLSDKLNNPTNVALDFFNEVESPISTSTDFVCWERVPIRSLSPSLNQSFGTKGLVASLGGAQKQAFFPGDKSGPVTLLGLIVTEEKNAAGLVLQEYAYPFFNDSAPVATSFVP
jgi:hypothetical protein